MSYERRFTISCDDCSQRATETCNDCMVSFLCDTEDAVPVGDPVVISMEHARVIKLFAQAGLVPSLKHEAAS